MKDPDCCGLDPQNFPVALGVRAASGKIVERPIGHADDVVAHKHRSPPPRPLQDA